MTELTSSSGFTQTTVLQQIRSSDYRRIAREQPRSRYDTLVATRQILHARAQRARFFNPRLFSDPAWDMLLELYAASLTHRRLSVSQLSRRSRVPTTTALRWLSALEKEGAVERRPDPLDGRRVFIMLSEKGRSSMEAYFEEIPADSILL